MKKRILIIAEMLCENITNGVSRHSEMLHKGMPDNLFEIIYLKFVFSHRIALPKRILHNKYVEMIIPLPLYSENIIENDYWLLAYNSLVEHIIAPYLEHNFIFHIQTMNLINLAGFLREKYNCKIVSHIHCIPWKYKYSSDPLLFNNIYYRLKIADNINANHLSHFVTPNEINIINKSDAVICVTKSSKEYYEKYLHATPKQLFYVCNGIRDDLYNSIHNEREVFHIENETPLRILYVGNVTANKGFPFVLEALRKVSEAGYNFVFLVAGSINHGMKNLIEEDYYDLNISLFGHVDYSKLRELYMSSHIGIISSLFEECSYVAVEMSMYGLPVVYSGIDELREVFGYDNVMYVPIDFSFHSSLRLNIDVFVDKIIKILDSRELRREISLKERKRYLELYTQEQMVRKIINIYNSLY